MGGRLTFISKVFFYTLPPIIILNK
jgi:hypothetical protein